MEEASPASAPQPPKLLDQVRAKIRLLHYSKRTEESYLDWIKRFIIFHNKRHPREMGAAEIESFLTHLAVEGKVAASTQNQAGFLRHPVPVPEDPANRTPQAQRLAGRAARLPVVLSVEEVRLVLAELDGLDRDMNLSQYRFSPSTAAIMNLPFFSCFFLSFELSRRTRSA